MILDKDKMKHLLLVIHNFVYDEEKKTSYVFYLVALFELLNFVIC